MHPTYAAVPLPLVGHHHLTRGATALPARSSQDLKLRAKSDHTTLAHGTPSNCPPPSTGEGEGGGEGHTAVPPILTFPRIGGKG
jgi:hypothetical protein